MAQKNLDSIKITHYINPHMFWFKYEGNVFNKTFFELEDRLQELFTAEKGGWKSHVPRVGEIIAVHYRNMNRWLRGKVDHIVEFSSSEPKYILWAVDHGLVIESAGKSLRKLPHNLATVDTGLVFFGGISQIVPAIMKYSFETDSAELTKVNVWSQTTVDYMENLICDASEIRFIKELETKDGQFFGSMRVITHANQEKEVSDILMKTSQAMVIQSSSEFLKEVANIGTNRIPRWLTNNKNSMVFKYGKNCIPKYNYMSDPKALADGIRTEYEMEIAKKIFAWQKMNEKLKSQNDAASAIGLSENIGSFIGDVDDICPDIADCENVSGISSMCTKEIKEDKELLLLPQEKENRLAENNAKEVKDKAKHKLKDSELEKQEDKERYSTAKDSTTFNKLDRLKKIRSKTSTSQSKEVVDKSSTNPPEIESIFGEPPEECNAVDKSFSKLNHLKQMKLKQRDKQLDSTIDSQIANVNNTDNQLNLSVSTIDENVCESANQSSTSDDKISSKLDRFKKIRSKQNKQKELHGLEKTPDEKSLNIRTVTSCETEIKPEKSANQLIQMQGIESAAENQLSVDQVFVQIPSKLDRFKQIRSKSNKSDLNPANDQLKGVERPTISAVPEKEEFVLETSKESDKEGTKVFSKLDRYKKLRCNQIKNQPIDDSKDCQSDDLIDPQNSMISTTKRNVLESENPTQIIHKTSVGKLDRFKKIRAKQTKSQVSVDNKIEEDQSKKSIHPTPESLAVTRTNQIESKNDKGSGEEENKVLSKLDRLKKMKSKRNQTQLTDNSTNIIKSTQVEDVINVTTENAEKDVPTKVFSKLDRIKQIRSRQNKTQGLGDSKCNTQSLDDSKCAEDQTKELTNLDSEMSTVRSPNETDNVVNKLDRYKKIRSKKTTSQPIENSEISRSKTLPSETTENTTREIEKACENVAKMGLNKLDRYKQIRSNQAKSQTSDDSKSLDKSSIPIDTSSEMSAVSSSIKETSLKFSNDSDCVEGNVLNKLDRYKKIRSKHSKNQSDNESSSLIDESSDHMILQNKNEQKNTSDGRTTKVSLPECFQEEVDVNCGTETKTSPREEKFKLNLTDEKNKLSESTAKTTEITVNMEKLSIGKESENNENNNNEVAGPLNKGNDVNQQEAGNILRNDSKNQLNRKDTDDGRNKVTALLNRLTVKASTASSVHKTNTNLPDKCIIIPGGYDMRNLQNTKERADEKQFIPNHRINRKRKNDCLNNLTETCVESNLAKHLVLVHGKHLPKPIDKLVNANFCEDVHRELEYMRFTEIYRIQAYTWPHLMRGNSLVVVNGARTGKTMSYLPAICSLIKMKTNENQIPEGVGPVAIIIAPSAVEVENIAKYCRRLFQNNSKKMSTVESFGIRNEVKTQSLLLNGCAILVSTPGSMTRLLAKDISYFDSKRIRHVIFDNIGNIYDDFKSDMLLILKKCCNLARKTDVTPVQLVITSRIWKPFLSAFFKMCNNMQLCIGSYIDAAVYGRAIFYTKFIEKRSKYVEILKFLEEHSFNSEKLVIVCNEDEEVHEVSELLKSSSCYVIACCSDSTANEIALAKHWNFEHSEPKAVLICTDSVLPEIKCNNAQNLIHYSLPASWSKFNFRFSSLLHYYDNFVIPNELKKPPARSLILLDENNNSQLPKLIQFLREHGYTKIHPKITQLYHRILVQREEERISLLREFCPSISEFGKCLDADACKYRHVLTKSDTPDVDLPSDGFVKIKVLNVISPTHYCVRLLEHRNENNLNWCKVRNSEDYLKFNLEFCQHFSDMKNHQIHWPISEGDLCAIFDMNAYHRCQIISITRKSAKSNALDLNLHVKLIDLGQVIPCKPTNILSLPKEFHNFPPQAITVYMTGIVPHDREHKWDSETTDKVRKFVSQSEAKECVHIEAKISFLLKSTIWVTNIIFVQNLKSISTHAPVFNVKKTLLDNKFALSCESHLKVLRQMANECGLFETTDLNNENYDTRSDIINTRNEEEQLHTSWIDTIDSREIKGTANIHDTEKIEEVENINNIDSTHLHKQGIIEEIRNRNERGLEKWEELNEDEFCRISIGAFYTPNSFYIQKLTNLNKMEELYEEIDIYAAQNHHRFMTKPQIGMNCLAKFDGKFNRAKITKIMCDGLTNDVKVNLFFCDIGMNDVQSLCETIKCDDYLITLLPFQCIRCKLIGIQSLTNGIWVEDICDEIYDNILDPCNFIYARSMQVEQCSSSGPLKLPRHGIILIDYTKEHEINLNVKIVEEGLAEYEPETRHFLDILINVEEEKVVSDSESEKSSWDDCNYQRSPLIKLASEEKNNGDLQIFDLDIQITEEDILKMLNLPSTAKIVPAIEETPKSSTALVAYNDLKATKTEAQSKIVEMQNKPKTTGKNVPLYMPQLIYLHKCPKVLWVQFQSTIKLFIAAPDINDYYLKITTSDLLFMANINGDLNVLIINFFGCVIPNKTCHKLRGLNVVIHLTKALSRFSWPRLTWDSDKYSWLKYDYDSIISEDDDKVNIDHFRPNASSSESESSSDSSDDEISEDYENADRAYDPLADDFGLR